MAKLTNPLPTELNSIKQSIGLPAKFSPLQGLAESSTNFIQAAEAGEFNARRRASAKAQRTSDASSAAANRSALDYALGPNEVNSESEMLSYELDPNDARRLRAGEAAVRQGLRSSTWLNAERSRMVDTLRAKGAADEDIVKAFRAMPGVDKSFFRDIGLEAAVIEAEQKNVVAAVDDTKTIELAKSYGLTGSAEYLAAQGRTLAAADQAAKQKLQEAQLEAERGKATKEEMEFIKSQAEEATITATRARMGGSINSILGAMSGAWTGGMNKPEFETRVTRDLIPQFRAQLPVLEAQVRDEFMLIPGISADKVEANTKMLIGPAKQLLDGLEKNSTRYISIFNNLKAKHGIEFADAAPAVVFLENVFGKDISETFYQMNETSIKSLLQEVKFTDWSNPNAKSILMVKAGSLLRGEMSMLGQPAEVIDTALAATRDLAQQASKDINTLDPTSVSSIVNGFGQLGIAANRLSVAEGEQAHFKIAQELGRSSTWTSLKAMLAKPEYAEKAEATIQVVRSGATVGLRSLEQLAKTKMPAGFTLSFNKSTGRYEAKGPTGRGTFPSRSFLKNYGITPTEASNLGTPWADAANRYLSVLVATEENGLEPIKGSALQIRQYHALGLVPEGAKKTKSAAKTADELFEENFNRLEETIRRLPETLATASQMEAKIPINLDDKPFAPLIKDTATRYNVPMNVITALLSVENAALNPDAKGPMITKGSHKGDRAAGLFQIMEKTAQGLGIDRNSVEGNIEGGIKLLAENFARTGNWRDAIAMYHSGVTFDEAKNRTDGGMKTVDYVARILQRAGLAG